MSRNEVDANEVRQLYFKRKLTQKEVAERLGVSRFTIGNILQDHGWKRHNYKKFETEDEKRTSRRNDAKRFRKKVHELREKLFGTECKICGANKEERNFPIHRKDGTEHHPDALWRLEFLESLNPDEWVALDTPCHRGIHWLMDKHSIKWDEVESILEKKSHSHPKVREPLPLPNDDATSHIRYEEAKRDFHGKSDDLRRVIFGENCYSCGVHYEEKTLVTHRKDGRPHSPKLIAHEKNFRTLNPDDWVSLCRKCHRYVHWTMDKLHMNWADLESMFRKS
jgi:transposase